MRFGKPAALLAALILAACQNQSAYVPVTTLPPSIGAARGIDMPTDASDVIGELQGRPWLQFVARYYRDPASRWPALTPNEVRRLSALGLKIVTVWEWHSSDPAYFSYATGYNDALSAARQARTVGQPPGSAIYFAVDFNARGAALYQVDQYFGGINAGLAAAGGGRPEYKVGVYGSGAVCASVRGAGLAQYAWLSGSSAWDGTASYSAWNIRQAAQGARFSNLSFSHDANEARNDYGGFQLGDYANAASAASAVVTAAAAVPAAAAAVVSDAVTTAIPPSTTPAPPAPPIPAATPTALAATPAPTLTAPATARIATAASTAPATARIAPPIPTAPATARIAAAAPTAPTSNTSAAEVAALAAAEPAAAARAVPAATTPRRVVERQSSPRSEQVATSEAPRRERTAAHPAKESVASARKAGAVATNNTRAVAVAPRHAGGSSLAVSHEAERRTSAPRRSEDHVSHLQTAKLQAAKLQTAKPGSVRVLDRPERRNAEQRRPERAHRTRLSTS